MQEFIQEAQHERLPRRKKKSIESNYYRSPPNHELAPVLEKAPGINIKEVEKDKEFLTLMVRSGVELRDRERWTGVAENKVFRSHGVKKEDRGKLNGL